MRRVRIIAVVGLLALLVGQILAPIQGQQVPPPVEVKFAKYADLCDLVEKNKGKVLMIDFWATDCPPCKASFFHTVEMYKRLRDQGLVVISVSTFEFNKHEANQKKIEEWPPILQARCLKFLKGEEATFTNLILDEPDKLVMNKMRITSIPCIYVFNREGQWKQFAGETLKGDAKHRHPDVENYVKYCLAQPVPKK